MALHSQPSRDPARYLCALAASWLLGCGSPEAALAGTWAGQNVESLDGTVSAARAGWARGTSLTFSGSRITVALPGEPPRRGSYRVLSDEDGKLELEVEGHAGHVDQTRLTLETDRLLRWHLSHVHTLVLRRL